MSEIFPEQPLVPKESPTCRVCDGTPATTGYLLYAEDAGVSPDQYVVSEEGTYDPSTHTFVCDGDYLNQPEVRNHWVFRQLGVQAEDFRP